MSTKSGKWDQISEDIRERLTRSEYETWFSQIALNRLDSNLIIIKVPNKFIANWLRDKYLKEIKKSIKKILNETPDIHFIYENNSTAQPVSLPRPKKKQRSKLISNLSLSLNFDEFTIGECNRFAFSSALDVAKRPGNYYNPLYIFSGQSMGKTHLLNAIGNYILINNVAAKIRYVTAENFISDFNFFKKNRNFHKIRENYYNLDILLFDDIQYLANRKTAQEEFLSIFNRLYGEGKQLVISGDRVPDRLKKLEPQLLSRLGWGLLTEIQALDQKTKIDIIERELKEGGIGIPNDIKAFLVRSNNNIKILKKNMVRLGTYSSMNGGDINISIVKSLIRDRNPVEPGVHDIQSITSGYFDISVKELISDIKKRSYSYPRHLAMYLCRKYTNLSFKEIGYHFGEKDHSTVIYAFKRIEKLKIKRKEVMEDINKIEKILN